MRLSATLPLAVLAALMAAGWVVVPWAALLDWTMQAQRGFQEAMALSLRAVQRGDPLAVVSLCAATFLYGAVHAAGPGQGKVLLGGAALASGATMRRMAVLTLASSLAQAAVAVALIGALAVLLLMGARQVGAVADTWLAPVSHAMIAAVGILLASRGVRMLRQLEPSGHHHHDIVQGDACGCGHSHGPSIEEAISLADWREAAALVASIAIRPCTGALFLLAIALGLDLFWTATLAVGAMGLGTAAFNLVVAGGGVLARRMAVLGARGPTLQRVSGGAHLLSGSLIVALSVVWLARVI